MTVTRSRRVGCHVSKYLWLTAYEILKREKKKMGIFFTLKYSTPNIKKYFADTKNFGETFSITRLWHIATLAKNIKETETMTQTTC